MLCPVIGIIGHRVDRPVSSIEPQPRPTVETTHYRFVFSLDTRCKLKATGNLHAAPDTLFDNRKYSANNRKIASLSRSF